MTLENAMNLAACACLLVGLFFTAVGVLGILKLPDVYNRMHAATKCMTLGLSGIVLGTAIHLCTLPSANIATLLARAALLIVFQFLAGPVGAHLLAKAAYRVETPRCPRTADDKRRCMVSIFGLRI
jgi:multicomponent Na+:H+ antiporter subunit G